MAQTVFHSWHLEHGARMASFAGWDLPLYYEKGAVAEHLAVRSSTGLFDIAHMGRFLVHGAGAGAWLNRMVSSSVADLAPGMSCYGLLLAPDGGVMDDIFVYRRPKDWLVVVNAGNRVRDFEWLAHNLAHGVDILDVSEELAMLAFQGPRTWQVLESFGLTAPGRLGSVFGSVGGKPCFLGRTGYSGEDGAELFMATDMALEVWEAILDRAEELGISSCPVGLGARDSLRFEAGMPLYGHELGLGINPLEAGLAWACDFSKDFLGRESLLALKAAGGPERRLVALVVQGGVAREGSPVLDAQGTLLGRCVSGMFCPWVKVYGANAFLPRTLAIEGSRLYIEVRGKALDAQVVKRPLYLPPWRREIPGGSTS